MKINVGDTVILKPFKVSRVVAGEIQVERGLWFPFNEVESVVPRPLKVGDIVTWGAKVHKFEIVAIKGDRAVVYSEEFESGHSAVIKLSFLERVES